MEKTTIEYLKNINNKREKRNEIKNELIKKIRYFYWMSKETKDSLINKITEEFVKNENEEKSWYVFSEVSKQNKENKERKDKLTLELLKIKGEIQKEKRKYAMLKKMLVNEDFSWDDEYSIKKRKTKRDEIKVKVEQFNTKMQKLEAKKNGIKQEISQVEVIDNKKKIHNSWKEFERKETNYAKYSVNELLNYNIWLSKNLKNEIKKELTLATVKENKNIWFNNIKKKKSQRVPVLVFLFIMYCAFHIDGDEIYSIISTLFLLYILVTIVVIKRLYKIFENKIVWNIQNKRKIKLNTILWILVGIISILIIWASLIYLYINSI